MNMSIIPAIDLLDGSCVRLTHGDFNRCKVYDFDAAITFWIGASILSMLLAASLWNTKIRD